MSLAQTAGLAIGLMLVAGVLCYFSAWFGVLFLVVLLAIHLGMSSSSSSKGLCPSTGRQIVEALTPLIASSAPPPLSEAEAPPVVVPMTDRQIFNEPKEEGRKVRINPTWVNIGGGRGGKYDPGYGAPGKKGLFDGVRLTDAAKQAEESPCDLDRLKHSMQQMMAARATIKQGGKDPLGKHQKRMLERRGNIEKRVAAQFTRHGKNTDLVHAATPAGGRWRDAMDGANLTTGRASKMFGTGSVSAALRARQPY